jgi:hypothetical protein
LVTFTIIFRLAVILRRIKRTTYINNYLNLWYKSRLPQFGQWASADFEMKLIARYDGNSPDRGNWNWRVSKEGHISARELE